MWFRLSSIPVRERWLLQGFEYFEYVRIHGSYAPQNPRAHLLLRGVMIQHCAVTGARHRLASYLILKSGAVPLTVSRMASAAGFLYRLQMASLAPDPHANKPHMGTLAGGRRRTIRRISSLFEISKGSPDRLARGSGGLATFPRFALLDREAPESPPGMRLAAASADCSRPLWSGQYGWSPLLFAPTGCARLASQRKCLPARLPKRKDRNRPCSIRPVAGNHRAARTESLHTGERVPFVLGMQS